MEEGWRSGTSGYLKSGSLSPSESRGRRSKFFCFADDDECAPRADPLSLASRRSALACGGRCNRMTHPRNNFHALLVLFSPHCAEISPSIRDQRAANHILSIVGRGGKTDSPPQPCAWIQYPRRTTARDKARKQFSRIAASQVASLRGLKLKLASRWVRAWLTLSQLCLFKT